MKAMLLERMAPLEANPQPLRLADVPRPEPGEREILVRVHACGVCQPSPAAA